MLKVLVKKLPTTSLKQLIELGRPWKIQKIQKFLENYEKPTTRKSRSSQEFAIRRKSMFLHYCIRVINHAKQKNLKVDLESFNRGYAARPITINMNPEKQVSIKSNGYSRQELELMYNKLIE